MAAGTLQKHLLRQDQRSDNDVLVALAGIKQVTNQTGNTSVYTCCFYFTLVGAQWLGGTGK